MINHDAHGLKAYFHDCVMYEEDRIDKHGVERTDGVRVFSGDAQRQQPSRVPKGTLFC